MKQIKLPRFNFHIVREVFRNQISSDFRYTKAFLKNTENGFTFDYLENVYRFTFGLKNRSFAVEIIPDLGKESLLKDYVNENLKNGSIFSSGLLKLFSESFTEDIKKIFNAKSIEFEKEEDRVKACKIRYNLRTLEHHLIGNAYDCLVRSAICFSGFKKD